MSVATTVFVPRDSAALAVGADRVARRIAEEARKRALEVNIVRNGSRGLMWLETMVEVQTPVGRVAQMLRNRLPDGLQCVPEMSANKYALNIRFLTLAREVRPQVFERDVEFGLTYCNL